MLFPVRVLAEIREGRVDLAFRRWRRPRVLAGTRMRTAVGLVEITSVEAVPKSSITADDARRAGVGSRAKLLAWLDARRDSGAIYRVGVRWAGPDPRVELRARDDVAEEELAEVTRRLERLDAASRHGPWTRTVLELIRDRPAVRAPDLAAGLGRETQPFKRDVRKLKELGLTESLEVGYRLSPRGEAVLKQLAARRRRTNMP